MGRFKYCRPGSLKELLSIKSELSENALLLAGGSNLMVYIKERSIRQGTLVDILTLPELKGVRSQNGTVEIGASEVIGDLLGSPDLTDMPLLADALTKFANPLVRARATIGGNIADASPIADTAPPLLCLEAALHLVSSRGERVIPLDEFFTGPGASVLKPDEVLRSVSIPLHRRGIGAFQKLGLRNGTSCSVVSVAAWVDADRGKIKDIRIACGGVAPTPIRARGAERAFLGQKPDRQSVTALSKEVQKDIRPISDVRASAEYRREVIVRLLARAMRRVLDIGEE